MKFKLLLISFLIFNQCFAQKPLHYRFETINQTNGLSNNNVTALYKDKDGFLWVGTEDGLNKYDGTRFRIYRHYGDDSTSLAGNQVHNIYPPSAGKLWVSNHCWGLSELNICTGKSIQHKENKADKNALWSHCDVIVLNDDEGKTWIKNQTALSLYHPATKTFSTEYRVPNDSSIIYHIARHKNVLWLSTFSDIIGFDTKTKQLLPSPLSFNKELVSKDIIGFMNDDIVLSIEWEKGLYISDIKQKTFIHLLRKEIVSEAKFFYINHQKQLWVTTNKGLYVTDLPTDIMKLNDQRFTHFTADNNSISSIAANTSGPMIR